MHSTICSILDEMGFIILDEQNDFDINDYIVDSIQFITFIVNIEKKLNVDLSDDFLSTDILKSSIGLANKLSDFLQTIVYCQSH